MVRMKTGFNRYPVYVCVRVCVYVCVCVSVCVNARMPKHNNIVMQFYIISS